MFKFFKLFGNHYLGFTIWTNILNIKHLVLRNFICCAVYLKYSSSDVGEVFL